MRYKREELDKLEYLIIKILIIFSSLLIIIYLFIDTLIFSNQFQKTTLDNAVFKIQEREDYLNTYINNSKQQLQSIKNTPLFKNHIETNSFNSLNELFLFIANSQNNIMQVRFIDKNGFEKSRVQRDDISSLPYIVENNELQEKSKRDYFIKSKNENSTKIWFSSLDLNEEYGKVQIPYNATLRAILPLKKDNIFNGIIVVNYFMNDFMNTFIKDHLYNSILIDGNGFTLIHHDKNKSWGKYKEPKIKFDENKNVFNEILYKNDYFVSKKLNVQIPNELILILKLNQEYIEDEKYNEFLSKFLISLMIGLSSILLIIIISRLLKKVVLEITNYTEYTKMIDENIIISSTDLKGYITYASKAFSKISGYKESELLGINHNIVRHPEEDTKKYKELWNSLEKNELWQGEFKNITKEGKTYWVNAKIYPIFEKKKKVGYTAIRQDITDKKIIEKLSITDPLTDVYNRKYFDEILPRIINDGKRKNELISFIMIDVDNFKSYNDTYGHQQGDKVLQAVASVLKNTMKRSSDYVFRIGGEEFVCLCKPESNDEIKEIAEDLRLKVLNLNIKHIKNENYNYVTISLGVVTKKAKDIENYDYLYKNADKLLYKAKDTGRNRVIQNLS